MTKDNSIGTRLAHFRKQLGETIDDVSAAVEVETGDLVAYESGSEVPSSEMLAMLLAHYKVEPDKAAEIFTNAGYGTNVIEEGLVIMSADESSNDEEKREIRITVPADVKVNYTDMVQVMTNQYGVVINFLQLAPGNNAQVVSRIGMSKEHTKSLVELLSKNLERDS